MAADVPAAVVVAVTVDAAAVAAVVVVAAVDAAVVVAGAVAAVAEIVATAGTAGAQAFQSQKRRLASSVAPLASLLKTTFS